MKRVLSADELLALTALSKRQRAAPKPKVPTGGNTPKFDRPPVVQRGPLRSFDTVMRCASRRCNSPTYYRVEGIPYCYPHALRSLNDLILSMDDIIKELRNA